MDLYGPNPHVLANHLPLSIYADSAAWSAMTRQKTEKGRVKRSSSSGGLSRRQNLTGAADKKVEFLLLSPNEGLGLDGSMTSTPPPPTPQKRTSLIQDANATGELSVEFLTQNAILLTVACMGAFILFTVNLVGICLCKGYFKKKAQAIPLGLAGLYPQSLSHSRRCRYHTILRRFSLESQHDSTLDPFRQINEPPIVGPVPLSMEPQPSVSEIRRQANAFTVLEVPEIILMDDYKSHHLLHSTQSGLQQDTGLNEGQQDIHASQSSSGSRGWKDRFRKAKKSDTNRQEDNKTSGNLEGSQLRGGVCSILKAANGNTAVLPNRRIQQCNGVHPSGNK